MARYKIKYPCDISKYGVTQYFGENLVDFYARLGMKGHSGLDFKTPMRTPVYAAHSGIAVRVYTSDTGGKGIRIWDKKQGIMTLYFHLDSFEIKQGDTTKEGQKIALSGNTGKYTTGPHLHFSLYEVDSNGNIKNIDNGYNGAIDPLPSLASLIPDGTLVKNHIEPKVYIIKNQKRWWIENEVTFESYMGYPVNKAEIKIIDIPTFNTLQWGGIITNNR